MQEKIANITEWWQTIFQTIAFAGKGKDVCGLHLWTNLAVIPKVENLRKGNKNSVHEKWQEKL